MKPPSAHRPLVESHLPIMPTEVMTTPAPRRGFLRSLVYPVLRPVYRPRAITTLFGARGPRASTSPRRAPFPWTVPRGDGQPDARSNLPARALEVLKKKEIRWHRLVRGKYKRMVWTTRRHRFGNQGHGFDASTACLSQYQSRNAHLDGRVRSWLSYVRRPTVVGFTATMAMPSMSCRLFSLTRPATMIHGVGSPAASGMIVLRWKCVAKPL